MRFYSFLCIVGVLLLCSCSCLLCTDWLFLLQVTALRISCVINNIIMSNVYFCAFLITCSLRGHCTCHTTCPIYFFWISSMYASLDLTHATWSLHHDVALYVFYWSGNRSRVVIEGPLTFICLRREGWQCIFPCWTKHIIYDQQRRPFCVTWKWIVKVIKL